MEKHPPPVFFGYTDLVRLFVTSALLVLTLLGCGSTSAPATTFPLQPISRVVLILEENHDASAVTAASMPFLFDQGSKYATTANVNLTHPSLPNYIALTSGDDTGYVGQDGGPSGNMNANDNIFHQVAGSWQVWAQSMPTNCALTDSGPYAVRHTAAPYYTDLTAAGDGTCATRDIPFPAVTNQRLMNRFTFVAPDVNNDAHDGSLGQADAFLKPLIITLKKRANYQNGSTLIEVTFDEGSGHVYTAFINPRLRGKGVITVAGSNHYSMLRLNEELLGLPLLANAATAPDLRPALGL